MSNTNIIKQGLNNEEMQRLKNLIEHCNNEQKKHIKNFIIVDYFEGDKCPYCSNGTLGTYNEDKDNKIILSCDSCKFIFATAEQE